MTIQNIYLVWENGDGRRDRVLHIFGDHDEFVKFWAAANGLREWCAGARYPARSHDVQNHHAAITIIH